MCASEIIVGPFIFLIFINDVALPGNQINHTGDTSVFTASETWKHLEMVNEATIRVIERWCQTNRIIFNVDKTKILYFD